MESWTRVTRNKRVLLLVLIFFIYGTFSSSTPDDPGPWEAILGLLLVLLVGWGAIGAMGGEFLNRKPVVPAYVIAAFAWLLIVPSVVGFLIRGHDLFDYFRDLIPLLYLLLPVFLSRHMSKDTELWKHVLQWGLCFVGVVYSLRFFLEAEGEIWTTTVYGGLDYFVMDPAVLFGATFLLVDGLNFFYSGRLLWATITIFAGAFAYSSILAATVRAQIVVIVLATLVLVLIRILEHPKRFNTWAPLVAIALGLTIVTDLVVWVSWVVDSVAAKTEFAGLANLKDEEIVEILRHALSRLDVLLLGDGWGAKLYMSSSGGEVRYAHNVFFYFLWKTGILGIFSCLGVFYWIAKHLIALWQASLQNLRLLALWLACFNVVVVHSGLEPGFKMLTFGFILCLIVVVSPYTRHRVQTQGNGAVYTEEFLQHRNSPHQTTKR